jgi:hypothetical protein
MNNDALTLEVDWADGKAILTARLGDAAIHMDTFNPASAQSRRRFAKAVKDRAPSIETDTIEAEILRIADAARSREDSPAVDSKNRPLDPAALFADMPAGARNEAEAMLADPLLIQCVVDDVAALGVAGEKELTATTFLIGVSRLLDRPLSGIVQGPSSSGKSYLIEKTARLFPPEAVICATQMTPQALFHMPPGSLAHRFVVGGERSRIQDDERAEATRALREMISAGRLTKLMPMKLDGGQIETVLIEQEGPIAFVESTTVSKIFDEDANRCVLLSTDERPEQTRRIVRQLAVAYASGTCTATAERLVLRHHALQRMLEPLPVVVPYAERLGELIRPDRVELRRAFPHLIGMIRAVTLLYQRQRTRTADGTLVATADDYQIAQRLLRSPMARLLGGGLSHPARRYYERLKSWATGEFSTTEAKRKETASKSSVSGWLHELYEDGFVELVEAGRGRTPATWRLTDGERNVDSGSLPTIDMVFTESTRTHGPNAEVFAA